MSSIGQGSISIDDSTRIGQNAQDTANEVAGNVSDINSDNKLTPTEKLKLKQEYDKDLKLYAIDVSQLQSAGIPTTELDSALNNLTNFVTPLFKEMNRTSTVNRDALNSVFIAFATADKNASQAFVNMVQQVADDAKKAGSDAKEVGEKAQEAGETAKAAASQAQTDATKAKADATTAQQKAQSSIDQLNEANSKFDGEITSAKKSAQQALDRITEVDSKVSDLSTLATTQKKTQDSIDQLNEASTKFDGEITNVKKSAQQALDNITVVDSKVDNLSTSTTAQFNTLKNGYQEVISTVNNIDIGATNLLKNSRFDDKMNGWRNWCPQGMGTSTVEINPTGGGGDWPRQAIYLAKIINTEADKNNQFGIAQDNVPVEPSTEYVLQLFNDGSDPITLQHGSGTGDPFIKQVVSDHKAVWKFKTPADTYTTNIYIGFNSGQSGTAWISLTKLEKGNKATDWSPAPEDLASQTQITTLNNLIDQKVSNDQYQSEKTQTAKDIASKVSSNDFESYKIQTAGVISQKVATKDFSAYQATTAKAISSKVESNDFNTYKTQTDRLIGSKVSSGDFESYKTQTNELIGSKVSNGDFSTYKEQTARLIGSKVDNGDFSTYKTQTDRLIGSKVSNNQYQSDKTQTANLISQTVTNAVNNIDIGGRNLVINSSDMSRFRVWKADGTTQLSQDGKEITVTSSHGGINIERSSLSNTLPNAGDTVVISADIKGNSHIQFNYNNGDKFVGSGTNIAVTPEYKRYYATFNWNPVNLNKISFAIYAVGDKNQYLTIRNVKIEIGNKATDWVPAPEDLATSTEFDQINNAIKLKANSSDVTSQINVAVQGVQSEVNDKVSNLTTKVSQTDSAWRASVSTLGTTNMVYNGGFAHGVDGWNTENGKWTWSNQAQDQVQGNNAIQARFTGLTTDTRNNAASRPFLVCPGQKMSIGAIVTPWVLDSDPKKGFGLGLEFFASKDGTGARNSYHPEQWVFTTGRQQLKVENITVPEGVNSAVVRLFIQRNGAANFTCVQANMTPTLPQFIDGFATATDITASINNINLKVSNSDGSSSQVNINNDTILLDANKIIFNGNTSIQNGTISTAKIANAAINTAQIADGAINNAKIANASIDDAKINSLNGNKLVENSITANKINVNDLIANGINTKTLTAVNLNASTLTTPELDLGFNGTFTEDFDYTQATSMFLPKKNKGTLTFNHGVLQSKGNIQTYANGKWGGINDNYTFQAGIDNSQWTEVAPGYIKLDLFNQNNPDMVERTYIDPTGYYYKSGNGIASYLGNVLQTSQVQTPSLIGKYIGPSAGEKLLQIVNNGKHYGFQVGSYGGGEAVLSDFIYSATSSHSPDIHITENGHLVRTTSASKYKYNIKNPDIEDTLGDRLLNVHLATWNDKCAADSYAEQLSTGEEREKTSIDKYYGLIAEQLRDAGLDMFISYGKNHKIEGIQYDRAWVPLLSVIRRLNNKVNEYEFRLSKLEGANK